MAILVTGGAGFIGSHLCEALLDRGDSVVCIDNFNDYYDPRIKEKNIEKFSDNNHFRLYRLDITDLEKIEDIFKKNKIDKVAHLAARAGVRASLKDPILYEEVNVRGTLNLLELAKRYGIKNFVFGSSSSVYGLNKKIPFSEDDGLNNMISPYAVTKRSAELLCKLYHDLYKLDVICLRFFTVYGPRGRPDMAVYKFTKLINEGKEISVYGDGSSKRDYTYESDIIDGIIAALDRNLGFEMSEIANAISEHDQKPPVFDIINLGDSNTVELRHLISLIEKNLRKKAIIKKEPEQPGDVPITFADISKAKKLLGYEPKIKIEEGIKRFVEWYNQND